MSSPENEPLEDAFLLQPDVVTSGSMWVDPSPLGIWRLPAVRNTAGSSGGFNLGSRDLLGLSLDHFKVHVNRTIDKGPLRVHKLQPHSL